MSPSFADSDEKLLRVITSWMVIVRIFGYIPCLLVAITLSTAAHSEDWPTEADIHDTLGATVPTFFDVGTVQIRGHRIDTGPGQLSVVLMPLHDWNIAAGLTSGQPFMVQTFWYLLSASEDLFETGQQIGHVIRIHKTADKGQAFNLSGVAASSQVNGTTITKIVGWNGLPFPAGQPRAYFANTAVIMGTPEERVALDEDKKETSAKNQGVRSALLGVWVGLGFCNPNSSQGSASEVTITDINDAGQIHASYKFSSRPGMTYYPSGIWDMVGTYDEATKKIKFTPTNWIDRPNPNYQLVGFTLTLNENQRELSGYDDFTGPYSACRGGNLSVKKKP